MARKTEQQRREAWEDTVCGILRRRFGVQPIDLDERLIEQWGEAKSPWDAADAIGRRYQLRELEAWSQRGKA